MSAAESPQPFRWDAETVKGYVRPHIKELAADWGIRFTGRSRDGWLECAAFDREDKTPSAAIHSETLVYKDLGSGQAACSIFDLAVAVDAFADFSSAVNGLGQRFGAPPLNSPSLKIVRPSPPSKPLPDRPPKPKRTYATFEEARSAVARWAGDMVGTWSYGPGFKRVRYDGGEDGKRKFIPFHRDEQTGRWVASNPPGMLPLYRVDKLPKAGRVFFLEGEKCSEIVGGDWGLPATTTPFGSGLSPVTLGKLDLSPLAGLEVVILPDHDEPGEKFASNLTAALFGLDPRPRVRILRLPGLADTEDVEQWRDRLPDGIEDAADELNRLADGTPEVDELGGAEDLPPIINLTDTGNSLRIARDHGKDLRYCPQWGKWLCWDGRRWKQDTAGRVYQLARKVIQGIAIEAGAIADQAERKEYLKWAMESEARKHVDAAIHLARFVEGIPVETSELDRDPWLLNVRNGTVDLRTGELKPHRREDLITKLADVDYDPNADCPRWEQFELEIMDGDKSMVAYLRKIAGYSATGDVREHQLFFFYGEGRNGKSKWLDVIKTILGDYATTINANLITAKQNDDHPTGLTDLEGRRFVSTIEVADGKKMAEALVKQLTGGDPIKARRMRQDFYEFNPTHKLILAANHKPDIRGTDEAIWERVKLIPFPVTFVEADRVDPSQKRLLKDKGLEEKLRSEASGILAMIVRSCLDWQRDGMNEPETVVQATAGYRAEMDTLADFIAECCLVNDGLKIQSNDLYEAYKAWAKSSGVSELSKRKFGSEIEHRRFKLHESNGTRYRLGLGLKPQNKPD